METHRSQRALPVLRLVPRPAVRPTVEVPCAMTGCLAAFGATTVRKALTAWARHRRAKHTPQPPQEAA